jgi:succinyl-CoA synthetase alpha subunit
MSILINENTNVIMQGITGRDGSFHARQMIKDGTKIVAGVTPGKAGQKMDDVPVYNSVQDAMKDHRVDATIIFVPPKFAAAAVREAADAKVPLIITITEGVPVLEMLEAYHYVKAQGLRMIGPNCPGLISPGKCKIGIMPYHIHLPGNIGVISRSGTLTYEVVYNLTKHGDGSEYVHRYRRRPGDRYRASSTLSRCSRRTRIPTVSSSSVRSGEATRRRLRSS